MPFSTLPKSAWQIISVGILGSFLCNLDATIINVSLATLATDLHTTLSTIQWVTSGYLLALALVLPLSGWLVDRIGARRLYLICFTTFTISSALCGFAWSAPSLIGFRLLQGITGGLLTPMAQMMVARVAGPKNMARIMGYAALPVLLGPILGPVVAGIIVQHISWRWLFLINLPIGALGVVLALLFLPPEGEDIHPRKLDLVGLALLSPALVLFLYSADHVTTRRGLLGIAIAVLLLGLFFRHARRKGDDALLDLTLFRNAHFLAGSITQSLSNGIAFSAQMLVPYFLIRACSRTPSEAGFMMAPLGVGMFLIFGQIGNLTKRFGVRIVAVAGSLLALIATLPLILLAATTLHPVVLGVCLFLRGLGLGAVSIPSISAAYAAVPRRELPMATTTLNIVQRLGGPTLTTLIATFLTWRLNIPHIHTATVFVSAFTILAAIHLFQIAAASRLPLSLTNTPPAALLDATSE